MRPMLHQSDPRTWFQSPLVRFRHPQNSSDFKLQESVSATPISVFLTLPWETCRNKATLVKSAYCLVECETALQVTTAMLFWRYIGIKTYMIGAGSPRQRPALQTRELIAFSLARPRKTYSCRLGLSTVQLTLGPTLQQLTITFTYRAFIRHF